MVTRKGLANHRFAAKLCLTRNRDKPTVEVIPQIEILIQTRMIKAKDSKLLIRCNCLVKMKIDINQ
mgnify:FL=1